jgi:hypothetical protein
MVRLASCWLMALTIFAALACGGENDSPSSRQPQARPTIVRANNGPSATMDPSSGRPGTEVVVMGSGWQAGATVTISGAASGGASAQPYATTTATNDGSFTARFRLDRSPAGGNLAPGQLNLVAVSGSTSVTLGFDVLPPVPGGPVGPGGGGGPGG